MKWYVQVLRSYAAFRGRAGRKEWWMFGLIYLAVLFVLKGIDILLGTFDYDGGLGLLRGFGMLSGLCTIVTIIPAVSVTVRRLHDTDRSGWWYFIIFIPLFGIAQLLLWMAQKGQPGDNRYGRPSSQTSASRATILETDV
jgi:uncharacterized membrane protein YhaH (DUF805 family)